MSKANAVNTLVAIVISEKSGETHNTPTAMLARALELGLSNPADIAKMDKGHKLAILRTETENSSALYQRTMRVKAHTSALRSLEISALTRSARIASKLADKRETEYQAPTVSAPAPETPAPAPTLQTIASLLASLGFAIAPETPETPAPAPETPAPAPSKRS